VEVFWVEEFVGAAAKRILLYTDCACANDTTWSELLIIVVVSEEARRGLFSLGWSLRNEKITLWSGVDAD
jgi:hypothetical protein